MEGKKYTVVLIWRSGGDFHFSDVDLLSFHLQKNFKDGVNVICFTDTLEIGCKKMELLNVTLLPLPNEEWPGWWAKFNLFSPELEKYRPFLYLDLDTAVLKPCFSILPIEGDNDCFITLRDFYTPLKLASGVMWIPAKSKKIEKVWEIWSRGIIRHMRGHKGDQEFMRTIVRPDVYWQDFSNGQISSFKPRVNGPRLQPLRDLPEDVSIVCFHGKPRILEAAVDFAWVREYVKEVL